jgi:RNA polymerase sigma-70 factor, ECF subfamily
VNDQSDDADLARALIARDPRAPRELWRRFAHVVLRVLRRMLSPEHDIDDLVQEVFLCVLKKVPTLREPRALRAFIVAIAIRKTQGEIRRLRVRRWIRPADRGDVAGKAVVYVDTDAREALKRFYRVLDRINPKDRTLFALRFIEELPLSEVAEASGVSVATAKRWLARAQSKIRFLAERDPALSEYFVSHRFAFSGPGWRGLASGGPHSSTASPKPRLLSPPTEGASHLGSSSAPRPSP